MRCSIRSFQISSARSRKHDELINSLKERSIARVEDLTIFQRNWKLAFLDRRRKDYLLSPNTIQTYNSRSRSKFTRTVDLVHASPPAGHSFSSPNSFSRSRDVR